MLKNYRPFLVRKIDVKNRVFKYSAVFKIGHSDTGAIP